MLRKESKICSGSAVGRTNVTGRHRATNRIHESALEVETGV